MKANFLLITTILSASILLGTTSCSNNSDSMTASNTRTSEYATNDDPEYHYGNSEVVEDFIGQINYARIYLAKNNGSEAKKHVDEARNLMGQIEDVDANESRLERIESGRVIYKYNTKYKYHYFPIETGPMEVKKMGHGPIWAKNDLAVIDAEIVYMTVNLSKGDPVMHLNDAESEIKAGHYRLADMHLAQLTEQVVKVDETISAPVTQARDNILLAYNFVSSGNYSGASYALKHADVALNEIRKSGRYQDYHTRAIKIHKEIKDIRLVLSKPGSEQAEIIGDRIGKLWIKLRDWPEGE